MGGGFQNLISGWEMTPKSLIIGFETFQNCDEIPGN